MSRKSRRMFLRNVAAAALFAIPGANAQTKPQTSKRRSIHFDYEAMLDKDEMYQFLEGTQTGWDIPLIKNAHYALSAAAQKKHIDKPIDKFPDDMPGPLKGTPLGISWAVTRRCSILRGLQKPELVGVVNPLITRSVQITIQAYAVLLINTDKGPDGKPLVPDAVNQVIVGAFNKYTYSATGPEPVEYMQNVMNSNPQIKAEFFSVEIACSINKVAGTQQTYQEQLLALDTLYNGKPKGEITVKPGVTEDLSVDPNYFRRNEIYLRCAEKSQLIGRIPAPPSDPHKVELQQNQKPEDALHEMAESDQPGNCNELVDHNWPIMTLAEWPEFKVDWRDFTFDIGCGVRIVLTLPVLQKQISGTDLWAYTKYPPSWDSVKKQIGDCVYKSALIGGVLGVIALDPLVALAAFNAAFEECIVDHFGQTIDCMVPGLGLITSVHSKWQDVKL
jgi:hypothetical protein